MRPVQRFAVAAVVAAVVLHAGRAWAPYHVVVVDQVFFGSADCPNAQYVMMRILSTGMGFIAHQKVTTQNADGSAAGDFGTFSMIASHNAAGEAFIMGTSDAAGLFGIAMDETATGTLVLQDGRVCFGEFPPTSGTPVDCVAYGNFTGNNTGGGTPVDAPPLGMALMRQGNSQNGNDATDFVATAPIPRNNAGTVGTLGQCPGGAETPTPTSTSEGAPATPTSTSGASPATPTSTSGTTPPTSTATSGTTPATPTATGGALPLCVGDCNFNGIVSIDELIRGVNIALGSSQVSDCLALECEGPGPVLPPINCLIQAVNNALNGCPATPTPTETVAVAETPTRAPGAPLGVRRFSINPDMSQFVALLAPGAPFPSSGCQGFLELTAGAVNGGFAFIDVTDASDYLSIDVPAGGIAVCLKILRDQLPIHNAGLISCSGGLPLGIQVTQDHNIGVVGKCKDGTNAGQNCSGEPECPGGTCFTAAACTTAGGAVEGPERPHPGVCNGMFVGAALDTELSPPGTVVIAPDPSNAHLIAGIPIEFSQEAATPCGDERVAGTRLAIGFTTGRSISEIKHFNNEEGMTLSGEITGVPFSCDNWSQEDGPGTLVLSASNLDTPIPGGSFSDIVAQFKLVD